MVTALFPGSFDPVTNGHVDLIIRCSVIFDEVIVAVGYNRAKPGWLPPAVRTRLLEEVVADLEVDNVRVVSFEGLVTTVARSLGATTLVKGLRGAADWSPEFIQASTNRTIADVDTLFLPTSPQGTATSSSIVRELVYFGAPIHDFVPPAVARVIEERKDLPRVQPPPTID